MECGCGGEGEGMEELEERPLLENSDDESVSRKEVDWISPGFRLEVEQRALR